MRSVSRTFSPMMVMKKPMPTVMAARRDGGTALKSMERSPVIVKKM